jgi:large subunit ribosomal protein L9
MQVILLDRIGNLGKLGEIVRVRDGYARNFLIPKGLAKRATQAAIADFNKRREELEKKASEKLEKAKMTIAKLDGLVLEISQKAGVDGKLFGSVTNQDIADQLSNKGIDVLKSQLTLADGPIKLAGNHTVKVSPHSEVTRDLIVQVVPEVTEK